MNYFEFSPMINPKPNFLTIIVNRTDKVKLTTNTPKERIYGFIGYGAAKNSSQYIIIA